MLVLYHDSCPDGFCAAWLLKRVYPDGEFVPVQHGQPPPDVRGKDVIIVDFSYKRDVMLGIINDASSVVVLDHHESAQAELAGIEANSPRMNARPHIVFDMTKSGARLTWEYLYDKGLNPFPLHTREEPPWLVSYTEDRDLWRWLLPESRAVSAALGSYGLDFDVWNGLRQQWVSDLAAEGKAILRYQAQVVERHVKNATYRHVAGYLVPVVNATVLQSEIGHELSKDEAFSASYYDRKDGKRIWSLRSAESGMNVARIAQLMDGGGHEHAAGFEEVL